MPRRLFAALPVFIAFCSFCANAEDGSATADLFSAIYRSDLPAVKRSLAAGADLKVRDKSGTSALMHAAIYSNAECMRILLQKGADVNVANNAGATALMWSAGDMEKVRLLLGKGADVHAQAKSGRTALVVAAAFPGNVQVVKLLLASGARVKVDTPGGGAVFTAALAGDEDVLGALLAAGGDPNEQDSVGRSALLAACYFGRVEPVKVLLDSSAKVNAQSGRRPLAKVGLQELGEQTPLLVAASTGNPRLVQLLLERGANVTTRDMRGMTPLMMAASAEYQDTETVQLLLAKGSDLQARSNDGETALSWAAKWGDAGLFKVLKGSEATSQRLTGATVAERPAFENMEQGIAASLALLQASSTEYFSKSGCVGCHHQPLTAMAVAAARRHGIKFDERVAAEQLRTMAVVRLPEREGFLQVIQRGGAPMRDSLMLVGMAAEKHPSDPLTTALAHILGGMQSQDGAWRSHGPRQPLEYSSFSETAYAIRALQVYAPPGRRAEFARRISRARDWLLTQTPVGNEEMVKQLLGLSWSDARPYVLRKLANRLVAEQQPDGGWAQRPGFPTDAYATGQTLYALNQAAGMRASDPVYQRGVAYLRRTQLQDGSWHVRSRSLKFQPYFESGFPHGHDQWISVAGSAWATMAITFAADRPTTASRRAP